MTADPDLHQQQQAIKTAIARGEYPSLAEVILEAHGRLIQKLTRAAQPPAFWYNALLFALLTLLVCSLASLLLNDPGATPPVEFILAGGLGIALGSAFMIAAAVMHRRLLATLGDTVLDQIEAPSDLQDLHAWLKSTFSLKRQFWISALPALTLLPAVNFLVSYASGVRFSPAVYLAAIIAGFQALTALSITLACLTLPHRLGDYHLKLFGADPRSSLVIEELSRVLNSILITGSLLLALVALDAFLFIPVPVVTLASLALPWALMLSIFISNQSALARIIQKAKRKTLNAVQAQIESL
jgi:hypothetical protein